MTLAEKALAYALAEHALRVREVTPNYSPRIREYWLGLDPPLDILTLKTRPPWCAVFIQYVWDQAARALGVKNPLDVVRLEAYVQDYADTGRRLGWIVPASQARAGDLVLMSFGGKRWDHIGLVVVPPDAGGKLLTVEGNTQPTAGGDQREGGGVYRKWRYVERSGKWPLRFLRPAER